MKTAANHLLLRVLLIALLVVSAGLVGACANTDGESSAAQSATETEPDTGTTTPTKPEGLPDGFAATPALSGIVPTVVEGFEPGSPDNQFWFDNFSWQSFVALSWPAAYQRGEPRSPDDPGVFLGAKAGAQPVVWGTYKESFELFGQQGHRPSSWDSDDTSVSPCANAAPGQRVFSRIGKGGTLADEVNEAFSEPLIDQDRNYVYFEVRFDEAQYNFIRGQDGDNSTWLYLRPNLVAAENQGGGGIIMPASTGSPEPYKLGSLMIKAGWRLIVDGQAVDPSRFYTVHGLILDPDDGTCEPAKLGLVALHIVQKLETFPEWIWSTFEQVDNVPGTTDGPYSFNNGQDTPSTGNRGYDYKPASVPPLVQEGQRQPVQVVRLNAMESSTPPVNQYYRQAVAGTVWENYQLVVTQWPTTPKKNFLLPADGGLYPANSGNPAPTDGAVNPAVETYVQSIQDGAAFGINGNGNSCLGCHFGAADTDFSWVLKNDAYQPPPPDS